MDYWITGSGVSQTRLVLLFGGCSASVLLHTPKAKWRLVQRNLIVHQVECSSITHMMHHSSQLALPARELAQILTSLVAIGMCCCCSLLLAVGQCLCRQSGLSQTAESRVRSRLSRPQCWGTAAVWVVLGTLGVTSITPVLNSEPNSSYFIMDGWK